MGTRVLTQVERDRLGKARTLAAAETLQDIRAWAGQHDGSSAGVDDEALPAYAFGRAQVLLGQVAALAAELAGEQPQ
jgi:hypothetical protein